VYHSPVAAVSLFCHSKQKKISELNTSEVEGTALGEEIHQKQLSEEIKEDN